MIYSTEFEEFFEDSEYLDDWVDGLKDDPEQWDQSVESLGLVKCKWVPVNKRISIPDWVSETYYENTELELEQNKLQELSDLFDAWAEKHKVGWWEPTKERFEYVLAKREGT